MENNGFHSYSSGVIQYPATGQQPGYTYHPNNVDFNHSAIAASGLQFTGAGNPNSKDMDHQNPVHSRTGPFDKSNSMNPTGSQSSHLPNSQHSPTGVTDHSLNPSKQNRLANDAIGNSSMIDDRLDLDQLSLSTTSRNQSSGSGLANHATDDPTTSFSSSATSVGGLPFASYSNHGQSGVRNPGMEPGGSGTGLNHSAMQDQSERSEPGSKKRGGLKFCVHRNCKNIAIPHSQWDEEYCCTLCTVEHCREIFQSWSNDQVSRRDKLREITID